MPTIVGDGAWWGNKLATATAYSNQRKIDRCSNGVVWASWVGADPQNICFAYSADNGVTWTNFNSATVPLHNGNGTINYTPNHSFFIDKDDYAHVVYKNLQDGFIYYRRGTPNAGRTAWTWTAATGVVTTATYYNYPDVVAHREGTGWRVHVVLSGVDGGHNYGAYARLDVSSSGSITTGVGIGNWLGGTYVVSSHTYPSIDFNHTGDGKTVAGGTPHLYVAWSAGVTGTGKGIRFKKATYSGGAWTWGTEREIDSTRSSPNDAYGFSCLFDGTRAIIAGLLSATDIMLYERDAADTQTTTRKLLTAAAGGYVRYGSVTYGPGGDVYFGGSDGTSDTHGSDNVVYRKWNRSSGVFEPEVSVDSTGRNSPYLSFQRGYTDARINFIYTDGINSPFNITYDSINFSSPPVVTVTSPTPNQKFDPRLPLVVSWNYSDAESNPQTKYEVSYKRAVDSTYTVVPEVTSANKTHTIVASTFTDETDYNFQIRAYDGTAWSNYSTVNVRADSWTYGSEVISATQSQSLDTTGFEATAYQVEVATADAEGFGPWSAPATFDAVVIHAETLDAVPGVLTANVAIPTTGVGQSVYAVAAGPVELVTVTPGFTSEVILDLPSSVVTLDAALPHSGVAANIFMLSAFDTLMLHNGGPITIYWNGLFAASAENQLIATPPTQTVYIMPERPVYTDLDYRARFTDGFTNITRRVEILNSDGETLWDDKAGNKSRLIGGSVSVDYSRDERRSCDLELANFDGGLVHKPGGFWYDKVMRLWRGIEFYDKSGLRSYEVPVGVFMIDRVNEARFPKNVKVTARDFTKKCMLSKFTQATNFEANERVEDVIKALAANCGVHNRVLPTTGATLGVDRLYERGKSRWEAMKEIATAFGYELFFDAQGYLVMREFLDPTLSPVSHEFLTGPVVGNLVDWEKSANDTRIFNHISVIGADSDEIPVWADAINTNPLSPTNTDLLGDRVDTYESALVTTFPQAQALADTFLKIAALEEFEINMQSIVYPWLEAGEIVRFKDPNSTSNEPDRFLLTSFDIPMGLQPMSAVGRRVTIVS